MEYSGSGDVTAAVTAVDVMLPPGSEPSSSSSGCEPEDFAGFPQDNVALVQRGTCDFAVKAQNAQTAGASAVIVFNEGQPERQDTLIGTLGEDTTVDDPGDRHELRRRRGARRAVGDRAHRDLDEDHAGDDDQRGRRARAEAPQQGRQGRPARRAPGLRPGGAGHQRQRHRYRDDPRDRRGDGRRQAAAQPRALRLLGRRGSRAGRLDAVHRGAHRGGGREDRAQPELRHARLAELHPARLRRRR